MVNKDPAFSTENDKDKGFVKGIQSFGSHEKGDPGTTSTNQASPESEQSKEHFMETDQLYRTALMECYNG